MLLSHHLLSPENFTDWTMDMVMVDDLSSEIYNPHGVGSPEFSYAREAGVTLFAQVPAYLGTHSTAIRVISLFNRYAKPM